MDWKEWKGKRVFVQLKSGGFYSGKIVDVDEAPNPSVFLTILDKFGNKVTFLNIEILKIVEEGE